MWDTERLLILAEKRKAESSSWKLKPERIKVTLDAIFSSDFEGPLKHCSRATSASFFTCYL